MLWLECEILAEGCDGFCLVSFASLLLCLSFFLSLISLLMVCPRIWSRAYIMRGLMWGSIWFVGICLVRIYLFHLMSSLRHHFFYFVSASDWSLRVDVTTIRDLGVLKYRQMTAMPPKLIKMTRMPPKLIKMTVMPPYI